MQIKAENTPPQIYQSPTGPPEKNPKSRKRGILYTVLIVFILSTPLFYWLTINYSGYFLVKIHQKFDFADGACEWIGELLPPKITAIGILRASSFSDNRLDELEMHKVLKQSSFIYTFRKILNGADSELQLKVIMLVDTILGMGQIGFEYNVDTQNIAQALYKIKDEVPPGLGRYYYTKIGILRLADKAVYDKGSVDLIGYYPYFKLEIELFTPAQRKEIDSFLILGLEDADPEIEKVGFDIIVSCGLINDAKQAFIKALKRESSIDRELLLMTLIKCENGHDDLAMTICGQLKSLPGELLNNDLDILNHIFAAISPKSQNLVIDTIMEQLPELIIKSFNSWSLASADILPLSDDQDPWLYSAMSNLPESVSVMLLDNIAEKDKYIPVIIRLHDMGYNDTTAFAYHLLLRIGTDLSMEAFSDLFLQEYINYQRSILGDLSNFKEKVGEETLTTFLLKQFSSESELLLIDALKEYIEINKPHPQLKTRLQPLLKHENEFVRNLANEIWKLNFK